MFFFFFFQAEDGIRDYKVTGVQTCALPIYLGVVVDDDEARRKRRPRILHETKWPSGNESQRFDDQPRGFKSGRDGVERELGSARGVEHSESDAWEKVDQVICERAPARLEFPRSQVLGREAQQARLILLRGLDVFLEAGMSRWKAHAPLGPVDRLEARVAPGRIIVGDRPALADRVPHWGVDVRQRLRAKRGHHQRLDEPDGPPRAARPATHPL